MPSAEHVLIGHTTHDGPVATNERARLKAAPQYKGRLRRGQFVIIADTTNHGLAFLGRIVAGPFYPDPNHALADVEIHGEISGALARGTDSRPTPGSPVFEMPAAAVSALIGLGGDMMLGHLAGNPDIPVTLRGDSKEVLPRNVGIFGTVGSGKSNSVQVLVEEASASGWAVVLLDLEGEYVDMDQPMAMDALVPRLSQFGREPRGLPDFHVYHPISCSSCRSDSRPFALRLADFESSIIAELLQTNRAERNALLDCIDHFEQKAQASTLRTEADRLATLLDASSNAKVPYTLQTLRSRANERSARSTESMDFVGLGSKLQLLIHAGVFDQAGVRGLDMAELLVPGRVSVIDVSVANDTVKNLVTADLIRKAFAWKTSRPEGAPTLVVIEEAHSFMSREKVQTMQATLHMLRNVTRRGRKHWLSLAFVSQQPGHLPPEIFELCNTRLVHTLRSMHNLDALMATTSDVTKELWSHCPMLGTGEAILSTPQLRRSIVVSMRPAASRRRFVR